MPTRGRITFAKFFRVSICISIPLSKTGSFFPWMLVEIPR
jgi:hypothetical protein